MIDTATEETPTVENNTPLPSFSELGLAEPVLKAVLEKGYERPTPIQAQAIPVLLQGRDLTGGSQTGTGKTAAFCLPILSNLMKGGHQKNPRCLILEPTRELAQQVIAQLEVYGKYLDLKIALLHGGVKYTKQREALDAGVDIVVATPGRLLDHMQQKALTLKNLEVLVLDEADRMLDMGFMPDVRRILDQCPEKRQSLLFSATIPPAIEKLAERMLVEPAQIRIGGGRKPAETINHAIYPVDDRQKFDLLVSLLEQTEYHSVLIFTRTKAGADIIGNWLNLHLPGKSVVLHSDRTQSQREKALKEFKDGKCEILVATDIVARGIDISGVSHVINYDVPENAEDYVHRIGRTGRAAKTGDAVTLYTAQDKDFLGAIERFIGKTIERKQLDGFDYAYTPAMSHEKTRKKKRNRGFQAPGSHTPRWHR
ncbi:MAG: DEAD/DEAH box helicase [Verrucomicrobiota bacterium JB022]|nr:DEAD/DEAH box helicase [Verrucomicrobiota bacterium JB022]